MENIFKENIKQFPNFEDIDFKKLEWEKSDLKDPSDEKLTFETFSQKITFKNINLFLTGLKTITEHKKMTLNLL